MYKYIRYIKLGITEQINAKKKCPEMHGRTKAEKVDKDKYKIISS